jgi:beta-lactamase regulating signal transducer with metallopeptidase domain
MTSTLLLPLLFAWAVEAMLLCAVAAGAVALARGISSATRHAIWTAAIGGVLLLPPVHFLLPTWRLPLNGAATSWLAGATPMSLHAHAAEATARNDDQRGTGHREELRTAASSEFPSAFPSSGELLLLWGLGTGLVLVWLAVGYGALGRISRTAADVTGPEWQSLMADVVTELGIVTDVKLCASANVSTPCLAGVLRPVILLPLDVVHWPVERRRSVLLHELAHVSRHDRSTQFLAQFACALVWFSPLHWYAARRVRIERERACDDRVLSTGISPVAYADVLLETAKAFRFSRSLASTAVAMARCENLEERLLAVLSERTKREATTRAHAKLVISLMLPLAVSLGAIRSGDAGKPFQDRDMSGAFRDLNGSSHAPLGAGTSKLRRIETGVPSNSLQQRAAEVVAADSVYARVLPNDGTTELVLTGREIRYGFTSDGMKSLERQSRASKGGAQVALPAFAREGISNMRIVFPIRSVRSISLDGKTLTLHMEPGLVQHDGRENRGVFSVGAAPAVESSEFIRLFDLLKSRRR